MRLVVVLAVAGLLLWRMMVSGVPAPTQQRAAAVEQTPAGALTQRGADRLQAALSPQEDPESDDEQAAPAPEALRQAFQQNPTDPEPLLQTAPRLLAADETARADAMIEMAVRLRPADPTVHLRAGRFWMERGELEQALRHWLLTLEADPTATEAIFPLMRELADEAETREVLMPLAMTPPSWWPAFFADLAEHSADIGAVRAFYELRTAMSFEPLTELERKHYIERLRREGRIVEAYLAWLNGLSPERRWELGLLYDGGFESEPTGWGFDWRMQGDETVLVNYTKTYGINGDQALHVLFREHEGPMAEVAQPLFLDPGEYRLSGRYRADRLATRGGLRWIVQCVQPDQSLLEESQRFLGSNKWDTFEVAFAVPASCDLQELRLVSVDEFGLSRAISGGIWFDEMRVRRIPPPAATQPSVVEASASVEPTTVPEADADAAEVAEETLGPVATVLGVEGEVLVTQAGRYVMAREGRGLELGDRLITLEGSTAVLEYSAGCRQVLNANRLLTINGSERCEPSESSDD
ncbi:hypothetical protein CCR82_05885 [Halochromatium salexigens]|uniref:Tetratricopeptide repeat protein n=2 Tax=Halochromatium salexigens TaxID=49447 RepID=A0AAJ0UFQ9_HALSE|nr:hypothetical protein [Halochromatium salexigens]